MLFYKSAKMWKQKYENLVREVGRQEGIALGQEKYWETKMDCYDSKNPHHHECFEQVIAERKALEHLRNIRYFIADQDKWGA